MRYRGLGILAITALLAACGGGEGTATVSPGALQGIAATGAAISGASVTAKCVAGPVLNGFTGTDGKFSLTLTSAHTAPCMLQVSGGTPNVTLHSFATASGQINISPVTDMIVTKALGSDPAGRGRGRGLGEKRTLACFQILPDQERLQERPIGVAMHQRHEWDVLQQFDAQFLAQFARECRRVRLPRGDLAAGELPASREMLARWPLCDQHPSDGVEQRACDDFDAHAAAARHRVRRARACRGSA